MPPFEDGIRSFHPISWLRVNALQLRRIADDYKPEVSADLLRIAEKWTEGAERLEAATGNQPPSVSTT